MHDVENLLGDDERAEQLDLWIDGALVGSLSTMSPKQPARLPVEIGPGFHAWELRGVATMKDGRTMPITGSGSIAVRKGLKSRVAAAPTLLDAARVFADAPGMSFAHEPVSEEDLAAAEARLGKPLPRAYRSDLLRGGAFAIERTNGIGIRAVLYHPREVISSWDWLVRYHEYTPTEEALFALKNDVCFGDFDGAMVFFYADNKRCPDGEPSFEHGFIDFSEMLSTGTDPWHAYLVPGARHCAWDSLMRDYIFKVMAEAVDSEEIGIGATGWSVYRTYEQPVEGELRMYLHGRQ